MKVFLRRGPEPSYFAGHQQWVSDPQRALDLETVEHAADVSRDVHLESLVIVLSCGDASGDWFLPLRRRQAVGVQTLPAAVQALLRKAA